MLFHKPISIQEVANIINSEMTNIMHNVDYIDDGTFAKVIRGADIMISGLSTISSPRSESLIYINNKYNAELANNIEIISAVITTHELQNNFNNLPTLVSKQPKLCIAALINWNYKLNKFQAGTNILYEDQGSLSCGDNVTIGDGCYIGRNCVIGNNTTIAPLSYIGRNTHIGSNVNIFPNVTILENVKIGNYVIIHSGAVLGSDGFGYVQVQEGTIIKHVKLPHVGSVIIHDNVEIGANCSIDRGFIDDTVIGEGTKIDNNVQIAHNVKIGKRCILAGQSGIAGSSSLGDEVVLFGQAGVSDHISIGDRIIISAQSGVMNNIQSAERFEWWAGTPAIHAYENWKNIIHAQQYLPSIVAALQQASSFSDFKDQCMGLAKQKKDKRKTQKK